MPKVKPSRKQDFRVALAIAGLSARQWCAREDISAPHLSMILAGTRKNAAIEARVAAFTKRTLISRTRALAS